MKQILVVLMIVGLLYAGYLVLGGGSGSPTLEEQVETPQRIELQVQDQLKAGTQQRARQYEQLLQPEPAR